MKLKKLLCGLFTVVCFAGQPAAIAGSYGAVSLKSSVKATYIASTTIFTPASSATDIFELFGSSTKTIKVVAIFVDLKGSGTVNLTDFYLLKRSTANSSGTSVTTSIGKMDSSFGAASAVAKHYTANPTTGSLDHRLLIASHVGNANSTASNTTLHAAAMPYLTLWDARNFGAPIVLRGTGEGIVVNLNGATIANSGSLSITIIWTEE